VKVEKTIKKIRKAIDKIPDVSRCVITLMPETGHFKVGAKNKVAFRFFRDQLEGDDAKAVNLCYGTGGRLEVVFSTHRIQYIPYSETGKRLPTIVLEGPVTEIEDAQDENYALPA